MKRIVFVCHGNICRSTMAEFLFRDTVKKEGREKDFLITSRATSCEELGNPVHPGTRRVLERLGISCKGKYAQRITAAECDEADLIIIMDENNRRNLAPFIGKNGHKVASLLSYTGLNRDISDPWYTGNFEETYADVKMGLDALWKQIK
ncbi:MAG: low molecular weight phosphotyrosine protein phosphatase [Ruminococcaceae bacterium]|nr:low molecular weight phosphotyrosine protein phosphatase [Oscillospiraceae bacterium]